ncbi:MAG TPA: aldose 1-epimerase [Limnochordales bacterium]|nr:aldose 1-epimerase [Limnochordales bacterium]
MGAWVEETTFLGQPAIRASNGQLSFVVVPAWGSNLISLVHEPTGTEVLRVPPLPDAFWQGFGPVLYGVPVLFPPNRIAGGRFVYRGREYRLDINEPERGNHIHGFVYMRPWDVVRAGVDAAGRPVVETRFDVARHADRAAILRQFPHEFVLTLRFALEGGTLLKEAEVHNAGDEPFPYGFGFHTAFALPDGARFSLDVAQRWRLDERMVPTGQLEDFPFRDELARGMDLAGVALDEAFFVGEEAKPSAATVTYTAGPARLVVRYAVDENFRHWYVYTADGRSGFVCPEPYTWIANAPNLELPAALTGLRELQPGQRQRLFTSITVATA